MSERTYTAAEVGEYQEARYILETLQASLEAVQRQRRASAGRPGVRPTVQNIRAQGEVIGLQVAIDAIKRRLR